MSFAQESGDRLTNVGVAVGLAASGMLLGFVALFFVAGAVRASGMGLSQSLNIAISLLALQGIGLVGTAFLYLSATDKDISYVRLRVPSLKQAAIGIGGVFAMLISVTALSVVIQTLGQSAAEHGTVEQVSESPQIALYLIPLSILVIGPCEEFLFRGVIQTKLRESFSSLGAVGVASVIFSLIHIPAYGSDVIVDIVQQGGVTAANLQSLSVTLSVLFVLSIILGYLYEKTGNLAVSMITHGFYNAVLFGLLYITAQYADEMEEMAQFVFF